MTPGNEGAKFRQLDVGMPNTATTRQLVDLAVRAESVGIRRLWLAEQHHNRGAVALAGPVAAATTRLTIGFGIVSPFSRHPAVIAMEVATLVEQAGPRFALGLGAAHGAIHAHGVGHVPTATGLREAGEICRRLLRGERVTYEGQVFRLAPPGVRLGVPVGPGPIPVFIGSMGLRTLSLAAGFADGVILGVFCSPEFVQRLVRRVRERLARSGRSPDDLEIASIVVFSVAHDAEAARRAAKPIVAYYLMEIPDVSPRTIGSGLSPARLAEIRAGLFEADRSGRLDEAIAGVPDDVVDLLAVAGTPEDCAARLLAYREAGVTTPILYHALGPDPLEALDLIAERLWPSLVG